MSEKSGHIGKKVYGGLCRKRLHALKSGKRQCIECQNELKRLYRKKNPEKFKTQAKKKYQRIRLDKPHQPRESGWRKHGINISYQEFLAMLEKQNYKCAICDDKIDTSAAVDHDHLTGKIRGALCINCNHGIGKFKENIPIIRSAAKYLESQSCALPSASS